MGIPDSYEVRRLVYNLVIIEVRSGRIDNVDMPEDVDCWVVDYDQIDSELLKCPGCGSNDIAPTPPIDNWYCASCHSFFELDTDEEEPNETTVRNYN